MGLETELAAIVGAQNVFHQPEQLAPYSRDMSLTPPRMPGYVARPGDAQQVQQVIKLANQSGTPVVPSSSGVHFHGATIPNQGGIVLDLRRMDRILEIDQRNRKVKVEPGVTWAQLQAYLEPQQSMALTPLLPHPRKSVVTSHLEREPMLIPRFEYGDPLLTMELVLGNGELLRTGSAAATGGALRQAQDSAEHPVTREAQPEGPGIDFFRLMQGAQGTMGVVTWANVKIEYLPRLNKAFFITATRLDHLVEPLYRIQRRMIGQECLVLNDLELAAILSQGQIERLDAVVGVLPAWTLLLVLSGGRRRPEEKLAYEEEALREVAAELSLNTLSTYLVGVPGIERQLPAMLRRAWPQDATYWKHCLGGGCEELMFITTLDKVAEHVGAVRGAAARLGSTGDVGFHVQPLEQGRACHVECSLFYDRDNPIDAAGAALFYESAADLLLAQGALFTRPYGSLADRVYSQSTAYTNTLRKMKALLDPNHILSPGRLCF